MDKLKHNIKKEISIIKHTWRYRLKNFLFNSLSLIKGAISSWTININMILLATVYIEENSKVFKQYFSVEADFNTFIMVITIINILLRFKTKDSLKDKVKNKKKEGEK